ncbi:Bpu10I family restriction endonuclease, partial [Halomonas sp. GFAJ-1]|uniref:Bpu10I family restriction endonuclease n=1 Tax=Halomonas sp. GFAJ-1 TaxID=1118153 RepID=UPI00023A5499
ADMNAVKGSQENVIQELVTLLNGYKYYMDHDLIFCGESDFLYRQKGQLKLDNSIIEEFMPYLITKCFPELKDVSLGPTKCFSAAYFRTSLASRRDSSGLSIRTKDQDFAIAKKIYLKSSRQQSFQNSETVETYLGYVTAECKTNLDKTMFQEATATAHDVKSAIPGSKYFLLCEWLDMTPISTAPTDIDEVLILRKSKRIASNKRKEFSTYKGRLKNADWFRDYLIMHPFEVSVFERLIGHIEGIMGDEDPVENNVLDDGFF